MCMCGVLGIVQGFGTYRIHWNKKESTTVTGIVHNFGGLVTVRFLLGIAEAGIFPGCTSLHMLYCI